jgi:hypothetical protein
MLRPGGKLVTRPPINVYSATATTSNAAIAGIFNINIGGTFYILFTDSNDILYYLDGDDEAVQIGTLEGAATIMSFNGVALIMDGGYLKYLTDTTTLKIAYDAGSGTTGFQFDNSALSVDSSIALGNGTNTRVAQKFTSPAWTAGYTIPVTSFAVYLSKTLAPTGDITVRLRKVSDDSILAAKVITTGASLGGTAAEYTATFSSTDITTQMSTATAYYISLEYAGGDAANYVNVHYHTEASGGLAYHYAGSWTANTTKNIVGAVGPGRPPKGKFGAIWNRRPIIAGDPDNPGYAWYGNLTYLDWSTSDGGGYIGVVDTSGDNFEVGALKGFFGQLFIFGTQNQPYLVRIVGDSPSGYVQTTLFQNPWTTNKVLAGAGNDLWYATNEGASP